MEGKAFKALYLAFFVYAIFTAASIVNATDIGIFAKSLLCLVVIGLPVAMLFVKKHMDDSMERELEMEDELYKHFGLGEVSPELKAKINGSRGWL